LKQRRIPTHTIEDGFDRQNLSVLKKRFQAVNSDRLQRMRNALADHHRLFLEVLPILFHCNHPMLPGFVSRRTPAKISGFKPSDEDQSAARQLARSFKLQYDPSQKESIFAIYVMGSVGTIAQSNKSDLDIWLCHAPELTQDQLRSLREKCNRITRWAASQRLEAHVFLMNHDAFKLGRLSSLDEESSGSAQRLLLLDEFYRSAIHLAGRAPLWWFVPCAEETHFKERTDILLHKRFVNSREVLDFGGVANIPEGEFIGAGVWQLYKAIESPYKSVLKLLLLEIYVSEYPNIEPLALSFKDKIYHGELDIEQLDSYVMMYRRIEQYLIEQGQLKRLELARRCFYFKVNRALSRSSKRAARPWQLSQLSDLVDEWNWPQEEIELLDKRRNWKTQMVASERALLVNELNHSYQFLLEFAQRNEGSRAISSEELMILGRKLQAAFERRPGKLEWINPGISADLSEEQISIMRGSTADGKSYNWAAYAVFGPSATSRTQVLRSTSSFVELVLWCQFNGVIDVQTHIDLTDVPNLSQKQIRKLLQILKGWLPKPKASAPHDNFKTAAEPQKALLLLNVDEDSMKHHNNQAIRRLSEQSDPLHFGGSEENLIQSADLVTLNSWQEVHTRRFVGETALLDALREYMQLALPGTHHHAPPIEIECLGEEHSNTIKHRVGQWFDEIGACFYSNNAELSSQRRYLFQMGSRHHVLYFRGMRPLVDSFIDEKHLIQSLAKEQSKFSGIEVDSRFIAATPLALFASKMKRNTISVFYRVFDIGMETYIADEKGSIVTSKLRGYRKESPLIPLHRFLRSAISRQSSTQPELLADFGICPISGDAEKIEYDFYCDDQEFSAQSFDDQLYLVVAQFILSRRSKGENYPIYITDLDLSLVSSTVSPHSPLQIKHYLEIKTQLEEKLNAAIGVLINA